MPAAKRPRRTRTKRTNGRAPLLLSVLPVQEINLRADESSLVCPDCRTWCPITGLYSKAPKVVPHHAGRAETGQAIRCPGSNQVVLLDIRIEQWGEELLAADSTATGRRSARQHYKPLPAPVKPVTKMAPAPVNAADALAAYRDHIKKCRSSSAVGRCGGTHRCAAGARLAALYERLLRTQPHRDREQREEERVDQLLSRYRRATAARTSAAQWARSEVNGGASRAMAKRGGTAVEEANNSCRIHPADTVSELRGPQVPLEPVHISA